MVRNHNRPVKLSDYRSRAQCVEFDRISRSSQSQQKIGRAFRGVQQREIVRWTCNISLCAAYEVTEASLGKSFVRNVHRPGSEPAPKTDTV